MIHKRNALLFFLLFLTWGQIAAASFTTNPYVSDQLKKIPAKDQEALTLFFETLLSNDFAYTLFGDKPVSCNNYPLEGDGSIKCSCLNYGKKIWEQYSALFTSSKFIFKYQPRDLYRFPLEDIFLINKDAFLQTVTQYLPTFQSILGRDITPEKLLHRILQENSNYEEVLNYHSGLIGLLYGFGYTNAFGYYKIDEIEFEIQKWLQPPTYFFKEDVSLEIYKDPVYYFQNLDQTQNPKIARQIPARLKAALEELSNVNMVRNPYPEENPLSLANLSMFPLPAFGADPQNPAETNILIEKYKRTRRDIVYAYNQANFLEITLCKLIEK
jgi:hypothetical protein